MTLKRNYDIINEEREDYVVLNKKEKVLVNALKGRISKALTLPKSLTKIEKKNLEDVCSVLDELILYSGSTPKQDKALLRKKLLIKAGELDGSKEEYINEHIIPFLSKLTVSKWGK